MIPTKFSYARPLREGDQSLEEKPLTITPELSITTQEAPTKEVKFSYARPLDKEESTVGQEALRHTARTASRAGETVVGMASEGAQSIPELSYKFMDWMGLDTERGKKAAPLTAPFSQKDAQAIMERWSKGYLAPKGEWEKRGDEVTSDVTAFLLSGTNPSRAIGLAIAGETVKEGTKRLGFGERTSNLVKSGAMFLLDLLTKGRGTKPIVDEAYAKRDVLLPKGKAVDATVYDNELYAFSSKMDAHQGTVTFDMPKNLADIHRSKIDRGQVSVEQLLATKKTINDARQKFYQDNPKLKPQAKKNFDELANIVDSQLERAGQQYPEWYKAHKEADAIFATIQQSKKAREFLAENIFSAKGAVGEGTVLLLQTLTGSTAAILPTAIGTGVGVGASFAAAELGGLVYRFFKNQNLQKYYFDILKAATTENSIQLIKSIGNFDRELSKSQPKKYLRGHETPNKAKEIEPTMAT